MTLSRTSRTPRASTWSRLVAVSALGTLCAGALFAAGSPSAQAADALAPVGAEVTPAPTPTETDSTDSSITLGLGSETDLSINAGDTARIPIDVRNNGGTPLSGNQVAVTIGSAPLQTEAEAHAWVAGDLAAEVDREVTSADLDDLAPGSGSSLTITLDGEAITSLTPGVYPLRFSLTDTNQTEVLRTVLTVSERDDARVTLVVPVTAGTRTAGLMTADEVGALTGPDGALTDILDATAGTAAVLAVDPAIVASIVALGSSAPNTATEWLERLQNTSNERFALQFGDADVAAQIAAGQDAPLSVSSLRAYELAENFLSGTDPAGPEDTATPTATPDVSSAESSAAPTATPDPTPTGTPTPDDGDSPAYPDDDTLFDIGNATASIAWPVAGTVTDDIVAALSDDVEATIVSSSQLTEVDSPAAGNAGSLLVSDDGISQALTTLADGAGEDDPTTHVSDAAATLWFAAQTGLSMLATIDRPTGDLDDSGRTAETLRDALQAITRDNSVTLATLSELRDSDVVSQSLSDEQPGPSAERVDLVTTYLTATPQLERTASALTDPGLLTGQVRAEVLQLLGTGWNNDDSWSNARSAFESSMTARANAISVQVPASLTLAGAEAPVLVWVRNDLPWPIDVSIFAEPDDARLDIQRRLDVTVPAASNPRFQIPVEARVGNGDVELTVSLRSLAGDELVTAQTSTVTVRADWEYIGIWIIGVAVGVLVIGGAIRMVIKRRSAARDDSPSDADE